MHALASIPLYLAQVSPSYGLLGLVVLVADILAIVSVLSGQGSLAHKVLWTLLILILPVIGLVLYLLLGRNTADVQA